MGRMLATKTAILLELDPVRMQSLVLGRDVVAPLALVAGEMYLVPHRWLRSLRDDVGDDAGPDGAATLADREPQPLLHRDRRDQLHLDVV